MKKPLYCFVLCCLFSSSSWSASAEEYVVAVEKINQNYKNELRAFYGKLSPQAQGFTASQQQQYCSMMNRYVDQLYLAADQNRMYLDRQYRSLTKQDVISEVMSSKEVKMLKRYNVSCQLS